MLGLTLLYVGVVLFLNGLWLLDRISDREIWIINISSGLITLGVVIHEIFGINTNADTIKSGAITLLFTITYFWVALNRFNGADGRGLGWFSLFVSLTIVPSFAISIHHATSALDIWFALSWGVWIVLWFLYFVLLALQKPIKRVAAIATLLAGIFTGWLPGLLLLSQPS